MKKKRLYPILTVLVLVVFFTMFLLSAGCHLVGITDGAQEAEWEERIEAERKAAEQAAKEEKQAEQVAPAEEAAASKEEKVGSFPNEPVTYTGDISGTAVILIVDFKTTEVTGSIENVVYDDYSVTDGNIDLDTLEIKANFSGVTEKDGSGNVITISELTVKGKISDDLSTFNGEMSSEEGTAEFTATR